VSNSNCNGLCKKHRKEQKIVNLHGEGMSTFLYLGSTQIINDTPPPQKKTKKKTPLNAISNAQF
jgi:hypothetical protein